MKKNLLLILALLISVATFAQTDYSRGFKNGYKEGYCYNDFGCLSPIPPITPVPLIGESNDNYQDGYNRGFKRGLEDKQAKKSNSGGVHQGGQVTYVAPDYSLLLKALEMKQAQYEKNEQMKKEKALGMISQVKSYYNSLQTFPDKIPNGWHKAISMNNNDFFEECKVYISNNQVTKYVVDDWIEISVSYPTTIIKAKAIVQLNNDDGTMCEMIELYFLENINNPNSSTIPPVGPGTISFWTSWKNSGNMELYFDGDYVGKFESYFAAGSPNCGQQGTITITYKPGTYRFRAVSKGGLSSKTWEGTVTIYAGGCQLQELTK